MIGRFGGLAGWRAFVVALALFLAVAAVALVVLRVVVGHGHATLISLVALAIAGSVAGVVFAPTKRSRG